MAATFHQAFNRSIHRIGSSLMAALFGEDCDTDSPYLSASRAMTCAPVWNSVNKITGAFEIMPLNIHKDDGRSKYAIQTKHSSHQLLRWRPNAYQTPAVFKKQMLSHALLWGNARAYIHRDGRGRPIELIPLMPDRTDTVMIEGEKWHATDPCADDRISLFAGREEASMNYIWISDQNVLHVPGLGFDGIKGLSLLEIARRSWGVCIDAEKSVAKQMKKGYAGGLMLKAPVGALRDENQAKEFLEGFRKAHEGAENAGTIGLLREGIEAQVLAMSSADAQFVEQRQFQREEAALWFNLQTILGDRSNSYASLEQKHIAYRTECLAPWSTKIEEECDIKLLSASDRRAGYYHKFNDGALLRTEKAQTMAFISQGIASRVLSPNEGRSMLDLDPYEGGDEYENPNTASGKDTGSGSDDGDVADESNEGDDGAAVARRSRIAHMVGVEARRVTDAAADATKDGKNYLKWIDSFYDNNWNAKLSDVFLALGLDAKLAAEHCVESKRQLVEVCGVSKNENLAENVRKCVSNWAEIRANYG